jgi:uncharacterized membrane protein YfcA
MPSGWDIALVAGGTATAAVVNTVAGGGSLVSYPALVATGMGEKVANLTNTLAIWPGYLSGAATLRSRLAVTGRAAVPFVAAAAIGAVVGSALALTVDADVFSAVVPFLVIFSALLLAVPDRWVAGLRRPGSDGAPHPRALVAVGVAGAYGAFFGGGLGVILLAVLNMFTGGDLTRNNALKAVLQLVVNSVALVAFVAFGPIAWWAVAVGAPCSFGGGIVGGRVAGRLDPLVLRRVVVVLGLVVGVVLLVT